MIANLIYFIFSFILVCDAMLLFAALNPQIQLDEVTEAWGIKVERVEMLVYALQSMLQSIRQNCVKFN